MDGEFISDEDVKKYERRVDPARRSARWSLAAVLAAFALMGGAYLFGALGSGSGGLTASLFRSQGEEGEVFTLRNSGGTDNDGVTSSEQDFASAACGYETGAEPKRAGVLISEVAWMGTEGGAQYEWVEIANTGNVPANIGGWSVVDKDEQIQVTLPKSASISANGYFLLARSADTVDGVRADTRYTGNLKNEDEGLKLFNTNCEVVDEVIAAPKWPAGEVGERRTMERDLAIKDWRTSAKAGGTPRAANSMPPRNASQGEASGEHFAAQNVLATSTVPTSTPTFQSGLATPSPTSVGAAVVVISEIMAGKDGAANWDFVELHNVGSGAVNLTGWSMKKKTASGSESALVAVARLEGKTIPADGYFLLAHPDYTGTPAADVMWPKSYTLAYTNNAVVLYDANGGEVDEVAWTGISKGQSYAEVGGIWVTASPTPKAAP